ncbi:MAG TPA: ABC transporter permease [Terriglobales bacterium]|nr:ABC transporter permease [Terriglobales bacterium]
MSIKLFCIVKRELLSRVRTKGFLVFTLLIPLVAAGFLFMEYKIVQASKNVSSTVAVVDLSQKIYPELGRQQGDDAALLHFTEAPATAATLPRVERQLRAQVLDKQIDGYLVVPADVLTTRAADYHVLNAAAITNKLESALRQAVNRARMEAAGISPDQVAALTGDFNLNEIRVSKTGDQADSGQTMGVAIALTMVLYVFLLMYGVVVMKSVTEEKTTRISEVLLSSVDAFSLMLGKILGVIATALAQLVIWGVCLGLVSVYGLGMAKAAGTDLSKYIPHVSPWLYVCFVIFFLLGFLEYASVYAAIGAVVSSDQEAQQTQMPLAMLLVAAIYLSFLVMQNPSSLLSVVLSLIPFFAPVLMVTRVAVSSPPVWQVALSMALCLGTFLGLTQVTAKIYRVGILMTGKRPNLPELLRWLKYA